MAIQQEHEERFIPEGDIAPATIGDAESAVGYVRFSPHHIALGWNS
jgi:hypothetical protein